eukprot:4317314-Pleurochrysis_carterae.AAC.1
MTLGRRGEGAEVYKGKSAHRGRSAQRAQEEGEGGSPPSAAARLDRESRSCLSRSGASSWRGTSSSARPANSAKRAQDIGAKSAAGGAAHARGERRRMVACMSKWGVAGGNLHTKWGSVEHSCWTSQKCRWARESEARIGRRNRKVRGVAF